MDFNLVLRFFSKSLLGERMMPEQKEVAAEEVVITLKEGEVEGVIHRIDNPKELEYRDMKSFNLANIESREAQTLTQGKFMEGTLKEALEATKADLAQHIADANGIKVEEVTHEYSVKRCEEYKKEIEVALKKGDFSVFNFTD